MSTIYRVERFVKGDTQPAHLGGHVPDHWDQVGNAEHREDVARRWAHFWAEHHPDDRVRIRSITTTETTEEITAPAPVDDQEALF